MPPRLPPVDDEILLGAVAAAMALVKAYRMHGHLSARLDPLGSEPMGDPALDETRLVPAADARAAGAHPGLAAAPVRPGRDAARGAAAAARGLHGLDRLRDRAHLRSRRARLAAPGDRVGALPAAARRPRSARRCSGASRRSEGFEQYLRRSFLGQKQFSLEGLDVLVPMLDEAIALAAADGAHEVVIGMAHRGRLNALVHTVGRAVRVDPARVRGRALDRRARRRPGGRHGRRQVPPAGVRHARHRSGRDRGHDRAQPEPPRGRRPGRRGARARRADRPLATAPASTTRPSRCRC